MALTELLNWLVIIAYLAGTGLTLAGVITRREGLTLGGNWCAVAGFALHTLGLGLFVAGGGAEALAQSNFYFRLFAWFCILIYFALWWRLRLSFLALTAAPLALILFISSFAFSGTVLLPKKLSGLFFSLHIGSLFLSLALLAMAFGAGLAFIYMEKKIKGKERLKALDRDMPSLSAFDKANAIAVVLGFPLYTLGLITGFIWAPSAWNQAQAFSWDPKEIVALAIWFPFAFLFHQRLALGWRGRKPAILAIWVFVLCIISMVGINFLVPTHHSFTQIPMPS